MSVSPLFTPFALKQVTLGNRFVLPAMQRGMCEEGRPGEELAAYYRRRAEGGVPLIIGESGAVDDPSATVQPAAARIDQSTRDAWARCVEGVGEAGGAMMLQLWHEGALRSDGQALSPSGLAFPGRMSGRAATREELDAIRDGFVRSALIAREIGAAGVEIHAAHGYFLDQFLWHGTNIREDGYGGPDIADRARYPAGIAAAIRAACGPDFIIGMRISQWKEADYTARIVDSSGELAQLVTLLQRAGVDIVHASTRRFWEPEWPGDERNLAGWAKASGAGMAVMTVGSVGLDVDVMTLFTEDCEPQARVVEAVDDLERRLAADEFNLVAVGRALIADPDFVRKIEQRDYDAIRTFTRADLGQLEWDTSVIHDAEAASS